MKVLLAYDGSEYGDAALEDVGRACLHDAEIHVFAVAETWLPAAGAMFAELSTAHHEALHEHAERASAHSDILARGAAEWLRERHSHWKITSSGSAGAALEQILKKAELWPADLVIVGAHGRKGVLRLLPGSVSLGVVAHAPCSVRIARQLRAPRHAHPLRLLVAVDGSADSTAMLDQIRTRCWPAGTQVELITVVETHLVPLAVAGLSIGPTSEEWAREILNRAAEPLKEVGLCVFTTVERGDPKAVLLDAARQSSASCVFVGARGLTCCSRLRLGGVATAVAMRAHCSVEVVRTATSQHNA